MSDSITRKRSYVKIKCTRGMVALVDPEFAYLKKFKWHGRERCGIRYASRNEKREDGSYATISLHREVMGLKAGDPFVDHIDGDGLNCRKSNLRIATAEDNARNISGENRSRKTSKYLGVSWDRGAYRACLWVNGRSRHLGRFKTQEEANKARLKAEREEWGITPRRAKAHEGAGL